MTLYEKLALVERKMANVEVKLGHPNRRNLLVRKYAYNTVSKVQEIEDILILPKPFINPVSSRYVNLQVAIEGADSIFISIDDLEVEIPRTHPKTLFKPNGDERVEFMLDPLLDESNQIIYSNISTKSLAKGYRYRLIFISEKDPTVWKLILRKNKDTK